MMILAVLDAGRHAIIIPLTHLMENANPKTAEALVLPSSLETSKIPTSGFWNGPGQKFVDAWDRYKALPVKDGLLVITVCLLFLATSYAVFDFLQEYLLAWIGQSIVMQLRSEVFSRLVRLSMSYYHKRTTGEQVSRMTADVPLVERAMSDGVSVLIVDSLRVIIFATTLFIANWKLSCLLFLVLPVFLWPIKTIGRKLKKIATHFQERMGDLNSVIIETFSGIRIVKAFSMENREVDKFSKENTSVFRAMIKTHRNMAVLSPLTDLAASFGACVLIWFAINEVVQGRLDLPILLYFIAVISRLIQPLKKLSLVNAKFQQALSASERIFSILDMKNEVMESPYARTLTEVREGVEFKNVWFAYGNEMVLKNVSFSVSAGEAVAIVGPSGAGKTTILNLLLRFYDVKDGVIALDGTDIRDFTLESLIHQVSIVTQESILFNDTVRNNILYGNPQASFAEVIQCAKAAHAEQFIEELPQGYDTIVGERGASLSGGQRQRICIARAMLKDAPILLLDEATSELDSESEVIVREAISNLMEGRTTLTVAHRLATVLRADKIIVMDRGKVLDIGSHEDLKTRSQFYQKVVELQSL